MNRRTYIGVLGTAAVAATAGCSDVDLGDGSVTPTDEDATSSGDDPSGTDVQWGTVPGPTPARRRFVGEPLGTSDPSVSMETTVDGLLPTPLLANGTAWLSPFRRISLSDGTVTETEVPTDSEDEPRFGGPFGLADVGLLSTGAVDGDGVTALFDWSLNRQWAMTPRLVSPLFGDGVVVGLDAATDDGDRETTITAVATETGETQWTVTADPESRPRLAASGGTVYAAGRVDGEETVLSIDGASGETTTLWTDDTDLDEQFGLSSPVVADGTVYVSRVISLGDDPPGLWAIDAGDGSVRWRGRGTGFPTPVAGADVVVADGRAYEASDGTVRWRLPGELRQTLSDQNLAIQGLVATPNEVVVGAGDPNYRGGGLVAAVSVDDGSLLWQRSLDLSVVSLRASRGRLVVSGTMDSEEGTGGVLVME